MAHGFGHEIPLFRCVLQAHASVARRQHSPVDDVDARPLLVIEERVVGIVEDHDIYAPAVEISAFVELERLGRERLHGEPCKAKEKEVECFVHDFYCVRMVLTDGTKIAFTLFIRQKNVSNTFHFLSPDRFSEEVYAIKLFLTVPCSVCQYISLYVWFSPVYVVSLHKQGKHASVSLFLISNPSTNPHPPKRGFSAQIGFAKRAL